MSAQQLGTIHPPSPHKSIWEVNLRYDKHNQAQPHPDLARKKEDEKDIEKVPELVHTMLYGKSRDRIHAAFSLLNLSQKKNFRKPLGMSQDFIENICALLVIDQESDAHRRCQQHALGVLCNLLLEDPLLDTFIANDENCLPGLAKMLRSGDKVTQELAAKTLDYLCVTPENQTLVCNTDGILSGLISLLQNSKSTTTKNHGLQALIYLSANGKNRFLLAREDGLLDELERGITNTSDPTGGVTQKSVQVLYNLCLLKENLPVIAKSKQIRQILREKQSEVKERINSAEDRPYEGLDNDASTYKLTGISLDFLFTYDSRLNSKIILRGEGYNASSIQIGKHAVSRSMIEDAASANRLLDESMPKEATGISNEEEAHNRRRNARMKSLQQHQE
jgi:hypothetical protein